MPTDRQYTGQQKDKTGLYYYSARYYDPQLGQFVSPDTIVPEPTSVLSYNRFLYTQANPINRVDPDGHIDQGPYINPGSNCLHWCGGAPSMNPRRPSPEAVQESQLRQQQADMAAGYVFGGLEAVPYADTPNDVKVAWDGCGYRCMAGHEEPAGLWGRAGAAAGIVLPFGYRSLSVAADFGINTYKALGKALGTGSGLQRHHIVEKRFANALGIDSTNEMLSVALTKDEHQTFTNRWRKIVPYGTNYRALSKDDIWEYAQDVYSDVPELLDAAKKTIYGE